MGYGTSNMEIINKDDSYKYISSHSCFCIPNGPTNTRVSSVIVTKSLDPWNIGSREVELFHNPYTSQKINNHLFESIKKQHSTNKITDTISDIQLRELFSLEKGWPE